MLEKTKKILLILTGLALLIFVFAPSAQKPSDGKKHIRYWSVSGVKFGTKQKESETGIEPSAELLEKYSSKRNTLIC